MKTKFLLLNLFITVITFAQNWSYIGNSSVTGNTVATQAYGSAETVFKSDGTPISVSLGGNPSAILPKIYNGTSWLSLGTFTTSGYIGNFDLEIYNDEPYVAYYASGLKVKKYNGSSWVDVGLSLPGYASSTNYDFAIDNAGVPYVACFDRKIFKFDGTAWILVFTLPQTASGGITYSYPFTGDNTLTFNTNNDLVYNVTSNKSLSPIYKQFKNRWRHRSILGDQLSITQVFKLWLKNY